MNIGDALSIATEAQSFALQVALSGAAISGLVLLAARLLRRGSTPLRYGILLAGVFGLLAIPALVGVGLNVPASFLPVGEEIVQEISAEMLPAMLEGPPLEESPAPAEASWSVGDIVGTLLLIAWMGIASIGLLRLTFGLWKQRRAILGQPWSAAWWTEERAAYLAEKVGLRRFPAVHCSPVSPMPMVVGLLRPKIVLPEQAPSGWGQPQWEAVLLHEAAHIARRDSWAALAQCLAVILFWWCPLVHLMARRLNDLREAICDDYALEGPCDRLAYAELLVESAERLVNLRAMPIPVGLIDSARGGLEERITRLLAKEKEPMKKLSLAGKLLGASFLVAACLSITAATALSQTPTAKKIQIKIVIDGKEIELDAANLGALLQGVQPKPKPEAAPKGGIVVDPSQLKFKFHFDNIQVENAKPGAAKPPAIELPRIDVDAFSPDGKVLITSDGRTITVIDGKTGKTVAKVDLGAKPGDPLTPGIYPPAAAWIVKGSDKIRVTGQSVGSASQAKPDPRIEEIVKQAEKIKPGSGADIRRALEAKPGTIAIYGGTNKPGPIAMGAAHSQAGPGKHVIVLTIDAATGKILAMAGADSGKTTAKPGTGAGVEMRLETTPVDPKAKEIHLRLATDMLMKALHDQGAPKTAPPPVPRPPVALPATPAKPAVVANPANPFGRAGAPAAQQADVEALARQLERITIELQELRRRLDDRKK